MTQEQKDILLQDLCGRLPYGVKARVYNHWRDEFQEETITIENLHQLIKTFSIGDIKPYLFPYSDISEEHEFLSTCNGYCSYYWTEETFDWLNENHIDYRGLIEKGLAINAVGLNIY